MNKPGSDGLHSNLSNTPRGKKNVSKAWYFKGKMKKNTNNETNNDSGDSPVKTRSQAEQETQRNKPQQTN